MAKPGPSIRVSPSGMLILVAFLGLLYRLLRSSIYAPLLWDSQQHDSLRVLHACTCAASFLNVASHTAVAVGVLNDTYVLSILVGVGFDILTRILQIVWWGCLTRNLTPETTVVGGDSTILLLLVLVFVYIYHLIVHIQALHMNHSLERMQSVLKSSINNLRGIPGKAYVDHLFAYSDLGTHIFCWLCSTRMLQLQGNLWMVIVFLGLLLGISYLAFAQIPLSRLTTASSMTSLITIRKNTVDCSCTACSSKKKRQGESIVSFTVHPSDGICQLWLGSFEQLSEILASASKP